VQQTSPEEAYRKFEEMGSKQIDTLRKLTKEVMKKIQNSNILSKILK
jgi:tetratricopeptide repeat protein 30